MQVQNIYLDLSPDYIPFIIQATDAAGLKTSPTVDNLIIYIENAADAAWSNTEIAGSPFDPIQVNAKTGLWGVLVPKSAFSFGNYYVCLWECTIDGVTTGRVEVYFALNASQVKANVTNLDAAVSSRSTLTAAQVWAAGGRALTTPGDYKANVSALATEGNATANKTAVIAEVDANEAKIDTLNAMIRYLNGKGTVNVATVAIPGRNIVGGMLESEDRYISATVKLHIEYTYDSSKNVVGTAFTVI